MAAPGPLGTRELQILERVHSLLHPVRYALTGRIGLRLHGLACSAPTIEAVVFGQVWDLADEGEHGPEPLSDGLVAEQSTPDDFGSAGTRRGRDRCDRRRRRS